MAHLQRLERLSAPEHANANTDLQQVLHRLRWRLGLERLIVFAIRGSIASATTLVALSVIQWLLATETALSWLATAPVIAAVVFGLVRWPRRMETAMLVDRRYGLQERLATAVELVDGSRVSRFGALQLQDAVNTAAAARGTWLLLDPRARREAIAALAAISVAAATLVLLPRLPRPAYQTSTPAAQEMSDIAPVDDVAERAPPLPLDTADAAPATPASVPGAAPPADLAQRVQQEQAERSALDKLAQALGTISAGQPAAESVQQGDFSAARAQLQNLADNADQLTDAAKQQLARGLQQAAAATTQTDPALAQREQQAAQALARTSYDDQRQALRGLADQVDRSSARTVPADQLEREVGQLQQQSASASRSSASVAQTGARASQSDASTSGPGQPSAADGAQGAATAASDQSGNGQGDQTGAGVGSGTDPNLYSDQPSRLDATGQQVQVPLKLGSGPGVRPVDGSEDEAAPDPRLSGGTASELAQPQQTGQVAPERNLVPGEQRPVVRGYFR